MNAFILVSFNTALLLLSNSIAHTPHYYNLPIKQTSCAGYDAPG